MLISLTLHGAVLTGWAVTRPLSLGETAESRTAVTLQATIAAPERAAEKQLNPVPTAKSAPVPKPKASSAERKVQPVPRAAYAEKRTQKAAGDTAAKETPTMPQQQGVQHKNALVEQQIAVTDISESERQRLLGRLRIALAEHFHYPMQARRHGWQGEVVLELHLERDGRIHDTRIARSSGHGVLDRAALKALAKIERLEHKSARGFTLQIPVIYRLEG